MKGLLNRNDDFIVRYQQAVDFAEKQESILWFEKEIQVAKDVQDIITNLTEAERHGVITTLKLFTKYETIIGNEYWQDVVFNTFQSPADIQRMAKTFSFIELCVHAPFYNKINAALNLDTEEFYKEYLNDPVLSNRIESLHSPIKDINRSDPASIASALIALSFAEGVILYSNFAFLKHFQSQGKNKLTNICAGINFSVRDEGLHAEASSWLFKTLCKDYSISGLDQIAYDLASEVYQHEVAIIDKIFSVGTIENITDVQMVRFVESRINLVLRTLGFKTMFHTNYNPIKDWFYNSANGYISGDFFVRTNREYVRTWSEADFSW